jgi:hypothetical protein
MSEIHTFHGEDHVIEDHHNPNFHIDSMLGIVKILKTKGRLDLTEGGWLGCVVSDGNGLVATCSRGKEILTVCAERPFDSFIKQTTGIDRAAAVVEKKCALCRKDLGTFRDKLSEREAAISQTCQACQDSLFS